MEAEIALVEKIRLVMKMTWTEDWRDDDCINHATVKERKKKCNHPELGHHHHVHHHFPPHQDDHRLH